MRRRILGLVLFVTAVAVTTQFVPAAVAVRSRDLAAQEVELQRDAAVVAAALPVTDVAEAVLPSEGDHDYGLYDRHGDITTGDGPAVAEPAVLGALDGESIVTVSNDQLVTAVRIRTDDPSGPLLLRAAEPREESRRASISSITNLGLTALGVLAGAGALAWLLAARLARPVEHLRAAAARLDDGDATTVLASSGIAELDDVASALTRTGRRVRATLERERTFSADASHQLRTPLTAMRAAVEAEQIDPRPDHRIVLTEILGQIDRMESTVAELLALARDTHDDRRPTDLTQVVQHAARRWAQTIADAGRDLEVDTPDLDARPTASPTALGHALDILIDNAFRHGAGAIQLATHGSGSTAAIAVRDDGRITGEPDRLFTRRRADSVGTGIGLHLARTLIESEGGRIQLVRADPTTFEIEFPASREP